MTKTHKQKERLSDLAEDYLEEQAHLAEVGALGKWIQKHRPRLWKRIQAEGKRLGALEVTK